MNIQKIYRQVRRLWIQSISRLRLSIKARGLPKAIFRGFRLGGIYLFQALNKALNKNVYEQRLRELEQKISREDKFIDILHIPMGWNTELFQRFQHISLQIPRLGGLALYGGHPSMDRGIFVFKEIAKNLYIFNARDPQIVSRIFQSLEKKQEPCILRVESIDLVTTLEDVNDFIKKGFIVVYEYIDEINPDITGHVPDWVHKRHEMLLRDERVIVVATSDKLFNEVRCYRSKNFILSTNGVDLDHWRVNKGKPPKDLQSALNGKIIIGYHGAIAKWIDYSLLQMIAENGIYEIVLIGREHDQSFRRSGLLRHPRVHFLGSKSYFELNSYAIYYDIAILPFQRTELTDSVSPVKIFEYMAALKPIVTLDLPECRKYRSCLIAKNRQEFLLQLDTASRLRNDPSYLSILDKEARENSWNKKVLDLLDLAGIKI